MEDRQTDKQMAILTDRRTDRRTYRPWAAAPPLCVWSRFGRSQTDGRTHRQKDRHTHTDRQTDWLTDHGLQHLFHVFDQGLVDPHRQVTKHLSVLRQVKVTQTVLILPGRVLRLECLQHKMKLKMKLSRFINSFSAKLPNIASCSRAKQF